MHEKQLLFARKGDGGFNWGSACASKGDGGFNPTHRRASKGDRGFTRELSDAGGRRQSQSQTKVARNLTRSVLKNVSKRCNSNDLNSMFEIVAGELRAKLGAVSAMRQLWSGRDTCAVATGPGRAIHSDTAPPMWRAPEGSEGTRGPGFGAHVGGGGATPPKSRT